MVKKLFFIATLLYIGATVSAENYLVKSPDGKIVAELNTNKYLSLQFKYNGSILLQESSIGVTLNDGMDMGKNPKVASHKLSNHKETIHAPFYRQQNFETGYQELNLKLKNGFGIILRAYDEGVAYRFYTQRKGKTSLARTRRHGCLIPRHLKSLLPWHSRMSITKHGSIPLSRIWLSCRQP